MPHQILKAKGQMPNAASNLHWLVMRGSTKRACEEARTQRLTESLLARPRNPHGPHGPPRPRAASDHLTPQRPQRLTQGREATSGTQVSGPPPHRAPGVHTRARSCFRVIFDFDVSQRNLRLFGRPFTGSQLKGQLGLKRDVCVAWKHLVPSAPLAGVRTKKQVGPQVEEGTMQICSKTSPMDSAWNGCSPHAMYEQTVTGWRTKAPSIGCFSTIALWLPGDFLLTSAWIVRARENSCHAASTIS